MGQLFNAGRDVVANTGYPDTLWQGLSSSTPNVNGTNITEPSGSGYARQSVTVGAAAGGDGKRENTNGTTHAAVGGTWGVQTHSVYFTASSGGTAISFDDLDAPRDMVDGASMDFAVGAIDFDLS